MRRYGGFPLGLGLALRNRGSAGFNPASLFASSEKGAIWPVWDRAKVYSDVAATAPIADAGAVARIDDISGNGLNWLQATVANRPIWRLNGGHPYLEYDRSNDWMGAVFAAGTFNSNMDVMLCGRRNSGDSIAPVSETLNDVSQIMFLADPAQTTAATASGGTPSYRVNDAVVPNANSARRIDLYGTWPAATDVVVTAEGADLSGWTGFGAGSYTSPFQGLIRCYGIIARQAMSRSERDSARVFLAAQAGVTLLPDIPLPGDAAFNIADSYGQSLSTGSYATPVLSTAARFSDKMFTSGVHARANGADYTTLIPLVESTATESATPEGETPCSGFCEMIHERGYLNPFIAVANGFPGAPIANLGQGTSLYNFLLGQVTQARARAREAGGHFKFRAALWMQGESDGGDSAVYISALNDLQTNLSTDIKAITFQTENVWLLSYQLARAKVGLAHLAASDTYANIRVAMPMYFLPTVDNVHLTNTSSKVAGAYFGLAYKAIVVDGDTSWQPLKFTATNRSGSQLDITYNRSGLAFDTTIVSAQTSKGFRLFQSDGTTAITISSVALLGGNNVRITAAGSIPAGAIVRYGFSDPTDHTAGVCFGNLRDGQGDSIVFDGGGLNYPMHNWAVLQQATLS